MDDKESFPSLLPWDPEMKKERLMAISRLAKELLQGRTTEQLAVIAAQHLIYANEQKARINELAEELQRVRLERQILQDGLVGDATKLAKTVVDAYPKYASKIANDGRHEANRERRARAMVEWENWGERDPKGEKIAKTFAKKHCSKYGVTEAVMCRWIGDYKKEKRVSVGSTLHGE